MKERSEGKLGAGIDEEVPGSSKRRPLGLCNGILDRCLPSFRSKASFIVIVSKRAAPRTRRGPVTWGGTPGISVLPWQVRGTEGSANDVFLNKKKQANKQTMSVAFVLQGTCLRT